MSHAWMIAQTWRRASAAASGPAGRETRYGRCTVARTGANLFICFLAVPGRVRCRHVTPFLQDTMAGPGGRNIGRLTYVGTWVRRPRGSAARAHWARWSDDTRSAGRRRPG